MAEEFSKDTGTDFRHIQDSISDPKSNKYALATYSAVVLTIFLSGYLTEWVFSAFVAINLVIIYSLLPIFKFPKPGSKYFVKKVYNGLVNRKEGYEKIGDENRSEACNFYVMQILDKYKDLLEIEKPVVDLEDVYSYWASIYSGEQLLENLTLQEIQFEPEFLTAKGKIRYEFLKKKEFVLGNKANLSKEDEAYLSNYSSWQQTNLQYFNQYRKEITGVAAGEKEMGWLQASIPSEKDTPTTYAAKLKNQISIQKQVMENAKRFQATKGAELYTTNADGERIYSEAFGKYLKTKMKPSGKFIQELYSSYRTDKLWDKERTDRFMTFTFKGNDWESILGTYLEDEKN